jgi:EAL domain-containing protein (putative c-di-GMP-specific phosphodiesterase class I)
MAWQLRSDGGGPVRRTNRPDRHPLARSLGALERRDQRRGSLERVHSDVEAGLAQHEFSLQYQPRVALATMESAGAEALLRWGGDHGDLTPKAFLPTVRQTAAMVRLGRWVLAEACCQAAAWEARRPADADPLLVSVNVTALEVLERGFADHLFRCLDTSGLPIELLQVEIDAADQLGGDSTLGLRLQSLRHQGLRVAIDKVGPAFGLGSERVAADAVHIERRWVRAVGHDDELLDSLRHLVERAHESGARVCATGVQEVEELVELAAIGCDEAQGYLFCPPVDPSELDWIEGG